MTSLLLQTEYTDRDSNNSANPTERFIISLNEVDFSKSRSRESGQAEQTGFMIDRFLASVERRAFRMAEIATGNSEDALDIVQESMLALVRNYADRDEREWGALFQRILQNKIYDHHRKQSVRARFRAWFSPAKQEDEVDDTDPIQHAADPVDGNPLAAMKTEQATQQLIAALQQLPLRQRQAFMLRAWEGLSSKETAAAMACSEGSVKTHYSRALTSLRQQLEAYW